MIVPKQTGALLGLVLLSTSSVAHGQVHSAVIGRGTFFFDTTVYEAPHFVDIGIGDGFEVGLRPDGTIVAWGGNLAGQMNVPTLPAGLTYTKISAHYLQCAALRSDGNVVVWGGGSQSLQQALLAVPALPAGVVYTEVATGYNHIVALRSDGVAVAWGACNPSAPVGQDPCALPSPPPNSVVVQVAAEAGITFLLLSNGTILVAGSSQHGVTTPPIPPPGVVYTAVSGSSVNAAAIRSDGQIDEWGYTPTPYIPPPMAPAGMSYTAIDCHQSSYHFALRSDGNLVTWGQTVDPFGFLIPPNLPPGVTYLGVEAVSSGVLARRSDGNLVRWGFYNHHTEFAINPPLTVTQISTDDTACFALMSDGTILGAGIDNFYNLGGTCTPALIPYGIPQLTPGLAYLQVGAGTGVGLALRSDGSIVTWGGPGCGAYAAAPTLPPGMTYVRLRAHGSNAAFKRSDGNWSIVGANNYGQTSPPPLPPGMTYEDMDFGTAHACAIRSDGEIVTWGVLSGGVGSGPALPPGLTYTRVAAGSDFCIAIRSDGMLVGWGSNVHGETSVPSAPPGLVFTQIDAGRHHAVARLSDGNVVAWGNNTYSQTSIPPLPSRKSYAEVAAGGWSTALRIVDSPIGAGGGQANSAFARLAVSVNGGVTFIGDPVSGTFPQGPFPIPVQSGGSIMFRWNGPALKPYLLAVGPLNTANSNAGALGIVDIGTPPFYSDVMVLFDGNAVPWLFSLGANGQSSQSLQLPVLPLGPVATVQGLIYQPAGTNPYGAVLTAAHQLIVQ